MAIRLLTTVVGHEKLLRGMYDSCDLAVDFTADNKSDASSSVRLLSNMPLVRCLSVQQTFEDENGTRTIPAKAGCIMLELRSICISVYTAMNTIEEIPEGSYIGESLENRNQLTMLMVKYRFPMVAKGSHEMVHRYNGLSHRRTPLSPARGQGSRE